MIGVRGRKQIWGGRSHRTHGISRLDYLLSCTLHTLSLSLSHTHTHTHTHTKICFMQRLYRIQHPCIQLLHFTHTDTHTHTQCLEFGVTAPHSHILQNDLSPRLFLYLLIHRCKSHKVLWNKDCDQLQVNSIFDTQTCQVICSRYY